MNVSSADLGRFFTGYNAVVRRTKDWAHTMPEYRQFVWGVFCRILGETPQWSGKAVANWNLSVGGPDLDWDPNVGDKVDIWGSAHQRGDAKWIEYAKARNLPRIREINSKNHRVWITNMVEGDDDHGKSSTNYILSLQSDDYWDKKLRWQNKPYETADESILFIQAQQSANPRNLRAFYKSFDALLPGT